MEHVRKIAGSLGHYPSVVAVALAGSRAASSNDPASDFDLYVYATSEVSVEFRRSLAGPGAEIDNRFWEPGDEWIDPASGAHFDVMYRSPAWIEDQLERVLIRHEASMGYSTCFWYNVLHSDAVHDPQGWYRRLQERVRVPYPSELQRAIVAKNWPILRKNHSSYRRQIELALQRGDAVSVHHRTTAVLASYFDIWFALARQPHPGEKRLRQHLPEAERALVRAVIDAPQDQLISRLDTLLDALPL
jgi:uncharacterized protein DUF4037